MAEHELIDIVDAQGNPTGVQRDKAEVHREGLWHRDVHVWITDGTRLLQQQRSWNKRIIPGAWDISVGGHVAAGETYLDAAVRETEEEWGLTFTPDRFIPAGRLAVEMVMEPWSRPWMHRTVGDNFVVIERGLEISSLQPEAGEVIDARWYFVDQLATDLTHPDTAANHAPQPLELWALGIVAMRDAGRMG